MNLKTWVTALAVVFLIGCPAPRGQLEKSEQTLDFGAVMMGQIVEQKLELRNVGDSPLTLHSLEKVDGDSAAFEVEFQPETMIAPGGAASLVTRFIAPVTDVGAVYTTTLRLETDGGDATLTLTARTVPSACALPAQLDFGGLPIEATSRLELELENPLGQPMTATIGELYSTSGDHAAFTFTTDSARGTIEIPPESSRFLAIEFRPMEPRSYLAFVRVERSGGCGDHVVAVTGTGATKVLTWEPTQVDCGFVTPGVKVTRDVTFQNLMSTPVHLSQIKTLNISEFGVEATGTADLTRMTIPAATQSGPGEATLTVYCKPAVNGPRQTSLTFQTGVPAQSQGTVTIKVSGGGPDIAVQPYPALDFGKVAYFSTGGAVSRRIVRVTNVGTSAPEGNTAANLRLGTTDGAGEKFKLTPLNASTDATEFSVTLPPNYDPATGLASVEGRNVLELIVDLRPAGVGPKQAKLEIYSNDPDEPVVELTLTADAVLLPPCNFSLSESTLPFGRLSPPEALERSFTIRNNGTNAGDLCLVSGIAISNGSSSIYSLATAPAQSYELQPGEEVQVSVRAWPQGAVPATVTTAAGLVEFFISSDVQPEVTVPLTTQIGESCLSVAPNTWDFGAVKFGCASASHAFRIYGRCANPVVVNSVALQCNGTSCADFSLPQPPSIPSGGASLSESDAPLSFQAKYQPGAAGAHSAVLTISATHGGANVTYILPLSGHADAQGIHSQVYPFPSRPSADVLFVIDNSSGMDLDQIMLGNNFAPFIKYALSNQVAYQIAVTTTDPTNGGRLVTGTAHPETILTPSTTGVANKFYSKVYQGGLGSGNEYEADPALRALTPPLVTTDNAGFLRRDASLAIVALTDEPDQSPRTTAYYLDHFWNLKGHQHKDLFTFSSITGFTSACASDDGKLAFYADQTGGMKMDRCTADWARDVEKLGKIALGFRDRFFLDSVPDTSVTPIELRIDGSLVPQFMTTGAQVWSYDPVANAVKFGAPYVPERGQTLELRYQTTCY